MIGIFQIDLLSLDGSLAAVENATVTVRKESDGTLATIYEDVAGATGLANPFVTDGTDLVFYADDAERYSIQIVKGAYSRTLEDRAVSTRPMPDGTLADEDYVDTEIADALLDYYTSAEVDTLLQGSLNENVTIVADAGAAYEIDFLNGPNFDLTLTENCTITFANLPAEIGALNIIIRQDGTGSHTITWPTMLWAGGAAPDLTGTASSVDVFTILAGNSGAEIMGFQAGADLS